MKMKKRLFAILLALCLTALLGAAVWAEDAGFNAYIEVTPDGEDSVTVAVPKEDEAILAAQKPTLTVPCDFDEAYVSFGGETIASTLDTEAGTITFPVTSGGEYVITAGPAPSPSPSPSPSGGSGGSGGASGGTIGGWRGTTVQTTPKPSPTPTPTASPAVTEASASSAPSQTPKTEPSPSAAPQTPSPTSGAETPTSAARSRAGRALLIVALIPLLALLLFFLIRKRRKDER